MIRYMEEIANSQIYERLRLKYFTKGTIPLNMNSNCNDSL